MTAVAARSLSYVDALDAAIAYEMRLDPDIFFLATTVPPMLREFGPARARTTPISEPALTGMAIGAAAAGKRPVVFWRTATFSFVAYDQIVNQAAKAHYMFGGQMRFPIVYRASCMSGRRFAAQHSQSPWAMLAHVPGLKLILPSTPADAYGLMRTAIRDDNPVVSFEPTPLWGDVEEIAPDHAVPFGVAAVRRAGTEVTVVALGSMVTQALRAAEEVAADGVSVEVVDPRTLVPFDAATVLASVRRTGRLVIADEAPETCSFASEIAALAAGDRETFAALRAPVARVCAAPVPVPYSPPLEDAVMPGAADIAAAIRGVCA